MLRGPCLDVGPRQYVSDSRESQESRDREGDAPAEPPVWIQNPKTVPLGNYWPRSSCGPAERIFSGVCVLAARRERRPGVMKIWPCGQIRFTRFYLVLLRFRNREDGASHFSFCEISMDASAIQGTAGQTAAAFKESARGIGFGSFGKAAIRGR